MPGFGGGATAVCAEGQGDGGDVLLAGVAHQADPGAGVDAGGEEGAGGDVGCQVVEDGV